MTKLSQRQARGVVTREEAWAAHLVVKVKEPQEEEFGFLRGHGAVYLLASRGVPGSG